MKVLAIGNSFSDDAMRYLHQLARSVGENMQCINLYIGGCSLATHHRNLLADARLYSLECNGEMTGFHVSIREALLADDWDVVTLQNVSGQSPFYETYQPYLSVLAAEVRRLCPRARLYMHAVWGYADDYERLHTLGFATHTEMYEASRAAYLRAAEDIGADGIIPSGRTVEELYRLGIKAPHRDGFHMSRGVGRLAIAATWLEVLTGKNALESNFSDLDEPVTEEERAIALRAAHTAVGMGA